MKVLQINATYGYSSTGLIVKDIGDTITYSGNEALVACQTTSVKNDSCHIIGNIFDWKIHALLCRIFGRQGYYSYFSTKKFIKYLDNTKPDIVHLHNLHSNYINLNILLDYFCKKDIPTVITMHDCWYFTGKCFHYIDVNCDKFKTGCGDCPKKKSPPKSLLFDLSRKVLNDRYQFLSRIPNLMLVGCSKWICEEAHKSYLKNIPITQIYNGVNIDVFKPYKNNDLKEKYGVSDDCYIIMGMANKWLLPSNKKLLTDTLKILNTKTKLLIVGCNDEQIDYLKNLNCNIIPVGFIKDRVELAKHYSLANVFVNVTHADTLPTVNMESICCGTPVITYDSCGSPELILKGCGRVIKKDDIDTVLSVINEKPHKIDAVALKSARKLFDKNECYKKYLDIYNDLLNRKGYKEC